MSDSSDRSKVVIILGVVLVLAMGLIGLLTLNDKEIPTLVEYLAVGALSSLGTIVAPQAAAALAKR